jgi:heme exporter protein D
MFETQFTSLGDFFNMGGYAFNVWSVYTLFILFFFINLYYPLLKRKQIMREQRRRQVVNREMQAGRNKETDAGNKAVGPFGESSETT